MKKENVEKIRSVSERKTIAATVCKVNLLPFKRISSLINNIRSFYFHTYVYYILWYPFITIIRRSLCLSFAVALVAIRKSPSIVIHRVTESR